MSTAAPTYASTLRSSRSGYPTALYCDQPRRFFPQRRRALTAELDAHVGCFPHGGLPVHRICLCRPRLATGGHENAP